MKLFRIYQDKNDDYDTYDSAIVAANTEEEAKLIHPRGDRVWKDNTWFYADGSEEFSSSWAAPKYVSVEYIGEAKDGTNARVILASFNAG